MSQVEPIMSHRRDVNRALMERCRNGDQTAWSALVDRYERLVFGVAVGEGLSEDLAAEVAQETFGYLIESLDQIDQPERLGSWLMTVARRHAWRVRARDRHGHAQILEDSSPLADLTPDLVHALWVYEAVEQLEDPCRSLIRSLFFDPTEPSYSEISVKLGRPLGSIGPLRGRCLERLREILEETA